MPTKKYFVKEMFYTVQGEGHWAGSAALFIRLTGCNLWNGKEEDRPSAVCDFCDTDFVGTDGQNGGRYTADDLALKARSLSGHGVELCVLTGGEPLLQVDQGLTDALHEYGFKTVAVETNGSIDLEPGRRGIDWVSCSPKDPLWFKLGQCNELKVVVPNKVTPDHYAQSITADHFYVQPKADGNGSIDLSVGVAVAWVKENPEWRISTQTHKVWGVD